MGEAKRNSRNRDEILAGEPRCIYCASPPPLTFEHMPPRVMFKNKFRLSGMEFGACGDCNKGTSAADLVASFMARIGRDNGEGDWQIAEAVVRKKAIEKSTAVGSIWQNPNSRFSYALAKT
jgi:hypothetical protein